MIRSSTKKECISRKSTVSSMRSESKVEVNGLVADLESRFYNSSLVHRSGRSEFTTRSRDQQAVIDQMTQSITEIKREIDRNQCTQGMFERKLEEKNMGAPLFRQITHSRRMGQTFERIVTNFVPLSSR
jgi:hypothetical protein